MYTSLTYGIEITKLLVIENITFCILLSTETNKRRRENYNTIHDRPIYNAIE